MPRLRPGARPAASAQRTGGPQRLPQRWAIIAILTAGAAVIAYLAGGPVAAINAGAAVVVAHRILD